MSQDQIIDDKMATSDDQVLRAVYPDGAHALVSKGIACMAPAAVTRTGKRVPVYTRYTSNVRIEHDLERQVRASASSPRVIGLERFTLFADKAKDAQTTTVCDALHRLLKGCDERQSDFVVFMDFDRLPREVRDALPVGERPRPRLT